MYIEDQLELLLSLYQSMVFSNEEIKLPISEEITKASLQYTANSTLLICVIFWFDSEIFFLEKVLKLLNNRGLSLSLLDLLF